MDVHLGVRVLCLSLLEVLLNRDFSYGEYATLYLAFVCVCLFSITIIYIVITLPFGCFSFCVAYSFFSCNVFVPQNVFASRILFVYRDVFVIRGEFVS